MLTAFYDLEVSPPKYDFVGFLVLAEATRLHLGEDKLQVVIVPGSDNGFRKDDLPPRDPKFRDMMVNNIIVPMPKLLRSTLPTVRLQYREEAEDYLGWNVFPNEWTPYRPRAKYGIGCMAKAWANHFFPLKYPGKVEKNEKLVTITLRESHYWPERNSNRAAWISLGDKLVAEGFEVVYLPDVDSPKIDRCHINVSDDLLGRARLYEQARLNLFVNNGCAWLASFMRNASCLIFKLQNESTLASSGEFWADCGFPPDSQIPRDGCRLVWKSDDEDTLIEETFKELRIEQRIAA